MIHVISSMNRHLYEDAIETHFHIRHDIFVGERQWKALAHADGREIDSYDHVDTVYMLAIEGERIIGGYRLCPTMGPTMIDQVFPVLAAVRGVPSDPLIWEMSRCFVVKDRREGRVNLELMASVQEFCLDEGITHVSAVTEIRWLQRLQQMGCVVQPLGLPKVVDGSWIIATLTEVRADTLDCIRDIGNITGSVLTRQGLQHSIMDRALTAHRLGIENRL